MKKRVDTKKRNIRKKSAQVLVSSSSAETVANNEDLLTLILLRVRAGSLIRSKCVSRNWLPLISSLNFCNTHTLQNPNPKTSASAAFIFKGISPQNYGEYHFISLGGEAPSPSKPLILTLDLGALDILDSCNGLLLCRSDVFHPQYTYFVVNPTTSQFSKLPISPYVNERAINPGFSLAFDPCNSLHYKVVRSCVLTCEVPSRLHIEIYSSETRTSKLIKYSCTGLQESIDHFLGVYCNGRIHWKNSKHEMVHYDIDDSSFGVVPRPSHCSFDDDSIYKYKEGTTYFGESRGHLHLISIGRPSFTQFDVLELERDYSGWFVKYKVDLENSAYCGFAILFLAREENEAAEDDSCMFLRISGKLISYNIRDGTFKTVMDDIATYSKDAYYYTKTLAVV